MIQGAVNKGGAVWSRHVQYVMMSCGSRPSLSLSYTAGMYSRIIGFGSMTSASAGSCGPREARKHLPPAPNVWNCTQDPGCMA